MILNHFTNLHHYFLEKEMATHSSIPAWRIPRTEGPGWLQSIGSQSQTQLSSFHSFGLPWWLSSKEPTCQYRGFQSLFWEIPWRRKWLPIPVFLPEKSHGQRSLVGYNPWGLKRVGHHLATEQHYFPSLDSTLCNKFFLLFRKE